MTSPAQHVEAVTPPQWTFADRIRKVRRDVLGLDQGAFADRLEVSRKAYASWEMDRTKPRDILALARRVEMVSRVSAAWLLGVDSPTRVTRIETSEYPAGSRGRPRRLTLVTPTDVSNQTVAPGYGSSASAPRCSTSPDVPESARTVNNAHAA